METVYLETSFISYLTAVPSRDLVIAAKQQISRDWWTQTRERYELFVSDLVDLEISRGAADQAAARKLTVQGVTRLSMTENVETLASAFLEESS